MFLFVFLILFSIEGWASSWVSCDVQVRLIKHSKESSTFKIISILKQSTTGFGHCYFKVNKVIKSKLGIKKLSPISGSHYIFRYKEYNAMGSGGPISSKAWNVLRKYSLSN